MRRPERDLPRGLALGTIGIVVLYALVNIVYFRALPVSAMAGEARIGEAAAVALFGADAGRLMAAAVLVSTFGCISSTILYSTRTYLPMARDGVFFRSLAEVHPRFRTPLNCILAQGAWSLVLVFSGTYEDLYTSVIVVAFLFHTATGAAVFVLRHTKPDAARPYRVHGYPFVPGLFVLTSLAFVVNALLEKPVASLAGLGLVALGLPAWSLWRRRGQPRS